MEVGNVLYTGLAWFGTFRLALVAIVFTGVCIYVIGYGYKHMNDKQRLTAKTIGTITSYNCDQNRTKCTGIVAYTVDAQNYSKSFSLTTDQIGAGSVDLWYDPNDPQHAEIYLMSTNTEWMLIGFALIILTVVWGIFYLAYRYKWFAAVEGGLALI
jgi:hypothetical protein